MRARGRRSGHEGGAVRPAPLLRVAVQLLPLWTAWLLVVVVGRLVCRVAQRVPPVVRGVRRLRARTAGQQV